MVRWQRTGRRGEGRLVLAFRALWTVAGLQLCHRHWLMRAGRDRQWRERSEDGGVWGGAAGDPESVSDLRDVTSHRRGSPRPLRGQEGGLRTAPGTLLTRGSHRWAQVRGICGSSCSFLGETGVLLALGIQPWQLSEDCRVGGGHALGAEPGFASSCSSPS